MGRVRSLNTSASRADESRVIHESVGHATRGPPNSEWTVGADRFAPCPVVEGALIRFLVRIGESAAAAVEG